MPPGKTSSGNTAPQAQVRAGSVRIGPRRPLALIAGPCVIESRRAVLSLAGDLAKTAKRLKAPLVFKASYDKANRTSVDSFRGPGVAQGSGAAAPVPA